MCERRERERVCVCVCVRKIETLVKGKKGVEWGGVTQLQREKKRREKKE